MNGDSAGLESADARSAGDHDGGAAQEHREALAENIAEARAIIRRLSHSDAQVAEAYLEIAERQARSATG